MLTKVKMHVVNRVISPLEMHIAGAGAQFVQIREITGLGPVKAEINTTEYAGVRGASYNDSNVGMRNIVMTVGLADEFGDASFLRQQLYAYTMPQTQVRLEFECSHMPDVDIVGYVEACEPVLWSRDPEMQISVMCPDPDFVGIEEHIISGEIEHNLTEGFGMEFEYDGTLPTYGLWEVTPGAGVPDVNDQYFRIQVAAEPFEVPIEGGGTATSFHKTSWLETQEVTINSTHRLWVITYPLGKYVYQLPVSAEYPLENKLHYTNGSPDWPGLHVGTNFIKVTFSGFDTEVNHDWSFKYRSRFGGI